MASNDYVRKSVVLVEEAKILKENDDLRDELYATKKEVQHLKAEVRALRYAQHAPEQGGVAQSMISDGETQNDLRKMLADLAARNAILEAEVAKLNERLANTDVQRMNTPPQMSNDLRHSPSVPATPEPSDFMRPPFPPTPVSQATRHAVPPSQSASHHHTRNHARGKQTAAPASSASTSVPQTPISPQKKRAAPKSKGKGKQKDILDLTVYDDDDDEVKEINVKPEIIDLDQPEDHPSVGSSSTRRPGRDGTPPPVRAAKRRREEELKLQAEKRARVTTGRLQQALASFPSAGPSRLGPRRGAPSLFPGGETAPSHHAASVSEASTRSTTPTVAPGDDDMISRHSAMDPLNLTGRSVSRSLSPLTDIDDGLASPMPFPDEPMDVDNATPEDVKPPIQEPDDNVRPPIPQFDPNVRVPPIMGLSILNYLAALEDFHIDAERHQVCRKTRNSLSELYGGSPQRMAVDIVPGKSHDGKLQHWLFPQLEMNTFMPDKAGKHGFLFATRREFDDPMKVWKLWVGSGTKPRTWEYCGDYVVRETGELKGRLWDHLSTKSQKTWAKKVIMSYSKAKAKGNEEKEIASSAYVKIYQRIQERLGKGVVVTSEDVQRAFRDGDEHIRIMTTFCIGFDYSLIQHMSSDTAQGSAPTKERKKRATKGKQQEVVTDDHLAFKDEDDDTVVAEPPSQSTRQSGRLRDRPVKNLREVSPDEDVPMVHVDDNAWGETASDSES